MSLQCALVGMLWCPSSPGIPIIQTPVKATSPQRGCAAEMNSRPRCVRKPSRILWILYNTYFTILLIRFLLRRLLSLCHICVSNECLLLCQGLWSTDSGCQWLIVEQL
jgi:hypothetical protein